MEKYLSTYFQSHKLWASGSIQITTRLSARNIWMPPALHFPAPQKILRHLAKAEILPRICGGRGPPRPDGDGERGWNINKSRSPNSAAFTCSSCVSAVSICWMSNTDYKVQVESISKLHQLHLTALWGLDVTFYADWQSRQKSGDPSFSLSLSWLTRLDQ